MQSSLKFSQRLRRITSEDTRIARGHVLMVDDTGLLRKRPRRRFGLSLPLKGLMLLALGFVLFKSLVLASLGPATYTARLEVLNDGTLFEHIGAWALQIDPLTQTLSGWLAPLF